MVAAITSLMFVPLTVYAIDTALVEASYAQLGETLQAAAEDGASMIDQDAYRRSGGQQVVLDPTAARAASEHSLAVSQLPGLESWSVGVQGNTVTVSGRVRVGLLVIGSVTQSATRSASFAYGR
jgi:hypothetical protein